MESPQCISTVLTLPVLNAGEGLLSRARGKGVPLSGIEKEEVRQMPLDGVSFPGRGLTKIRKRHMHAGIAMGAADRQEGGAVVEAFIKANVKPASGKDLTETLEKKPLLPLAG